MGLGRDVTGRDIALIAAAACLCGVSPAGSQLPTVDAVQARFTRALGGADAILRRRSMTMRGFNVVYGPNGNRARIGFVIYLADFKRLEIDSVPGRGDFSFGYNGKTAWSLSPGRKAQIFTGSDAATNRRDADLYYFARIPTYFRSMDVVSLDTFYGCRCWRLRGITLWGNVNNQYYDAKTGLLMGYRFHQWVHGAPEKAESVQVFDSYRTFDGLMMATRETDYRDGRLLGVGHYVSIRSNHVEESVFDLPPAVSALLSKRERAASSRS
jgi:hypothetical protein